MATELDALPLERPRTFHLEWIGPLFFRPRRTLAKTIEGGHATWLAPLLVLTLLAIMLVLVAGPVKQAAATGGPQELPQDFQYWSPEQQQMYMQSASQSQGPVFI